MKKSNNIIDRSEFSFGLYVKDIRRYPTLTQEEQRRLAVLAKAGNKRALDRLIECNLRYVISMASQFQGTNLTLSDLIEEGNEALCRAAMDYDPSRGEPFLALAKTYIYHALCNAVKKYGTVVKLPKHATATSLSLDAPIGNDGNKEYTMYDIISNESYYDDYMSWESRMEEFDSKCKRKLNKRQQFVVKRYLDGGCDKAVVAEIANDCYCSVSSIRRILNSALSTLKEAV